MKSLTLLFTFISLVAAQSTSYFYITSPIQGSVFEAGATEPITWTNGLNQNATVTLLTGSNALTMTTTGVSFTIQGADEAYDWIVPTDLPQNGTFSLQITYSINGTTAYSYSSAFSIIGTTGQIVNSTFVSQATAIAPSTALPSSSSVSMISTASNAAPAMTAAASVIATSSSVARSSSSLAASTTPTPSISDATMKTPTLIVVGLAMLAAKLII